MQVVFLGGASGVGASCLAIELADQWFVVDAGVRVDHKADPLPDLAQLEGKDVRAIFVTHAHADHIGALPLLHRAFPTTPIFTSRGTALLMEVMLADALKIMAKRAVDEMELPLYPEELVSGMLMQVRSLPVGEPFTVSMLPGITIHASRAGHIAGAVSLGFESADGSIVVSGDISSTPQRTVLGATPPPVKHCDLLVLESTYGSRLHPNRQAEEQRLAQAVAEGLARGGHTLIPCFGLGRGQEVLLLLQAAQEQGQIPEFPIYVDGLVRRVCTTYQLLPEFLTPRLQRQIRKGFLPFTGPNITFVRDEKERERILAGPPACILSSSGMLTGGPSAWYAARLAPNPNASILITGYQDEESPGKKLLDLAEHKLDTLELSGQKVQVQCTVAKYSLSAHADGSELASFAAALSPRHVALVHGDEDARRSLRGLITGTEVLLPTNGTSITIEQKKARSKHATATAEAPVLLPTLPLGVGAGQPFEYPDVEKLWRAVVEVPTLRIITARELALVWYGDSTEEYTESILDVFAQDYEQRYFIRQSALEEAYRIRGQHEEEPGDFLSELVGSVLLLLVSPESSKPVICRSIEPGAAVRVMLPKGVSQERMRFPFSSILEVLGPAPQDMQSTYAKAGTFLNDLVKAMRRIRRTVSAHNLARRCYENVTYTLGELCAAAGLFPQSLEDRLALAKILQQHPRLFTQSRGVFEGEGLTLYALAPEWQEALEEEEEYERPDQNWILSVIENYLVSVTGSPGLPADLYRRSVDPDTGAVVLYFHFPAVAETRYAEAIAAAADEAGVPISIAPNAHQGILAKTARQHVPQGLSVQGSPSIYLDHSIVSLNTVGHTTQEELAQAQASFFAETGWHLEIKGAVVSTSLLSVTTATTDTSDKPNTSATSATIATSDTATTSNEVGTTQNEAPLPNLPAASSQTAEIITLVAATPTIRSEPLSQHDAIQLAQHMFNALPGFYKAGGDLATTTLLLRFYFPQVAQTRYAGLLAELEAQTGWHVRLHQTAHQQALVEMARRLLPAGLTCVGVPSLYLDQQTVMVNYLGQASPEALQEAQQQFLSETGWHLNLIAPNKKTTPIARSTPTPAAPRMARMSQGEAFALTNETFKEVPDFYRVGADANKGVLWVHFHFPDIARERYAQKIADLATQTGWKVYLYPYVHQKALIDAARHLLPPGVSLQGKASLYQDNRTLTLTCTGAIAAETREELLQQFTSETGWTLDLRTPVEEFIITPE